MRNMSDMMSRPEVVDQVGRSQLSRKSLMQHRRSLDSSSTLSSAIPPPILQHPDHRRQPPARVDGSTNPYNDEQPHGQADDVQPGYPPNGQSESTQHPACADALQMMQMQSAMGGQGGGMGGMGGLGNVGGFPNPYGQTGGATPNQGGANAPNEPFPNLFAPGAGTAAPSATTATGGSANPSNPLAALFGPGGAGPFGAGPNPNPFAGAGGANPFAGGANPFAQAGGANPFGINPAMFGRGGPGGQGGGGGGGGGNMPSAAQPRDTRPPEEIYATQLGQLNAMVRAMDTLRLPC